MFAIVKWLIWKINYSVFIIIDTEIYIYPSLKKEYVEVNRNQCHGGASPVPITLIKGGGVLWREGVNLPQG